MRGNLNERPVAMGRWFTEHHSTIRGTAAHFGVSKSTVWKDFTERLRNLDISLSSQVEAQLKINRETRHLRGGEATQKKWRLSR